MGLEEERKRATFDQQELTRYIYPNYLFPQVPYDRIRELREKGSKIPELNYSLEKYHDTRSQELIRAFKNGLAVKAFSDAEKLNRWERRYIFFLYPELAAPVGHFEFSMLSFILQASEEQRNRWVPKLESLEIMCCYAQTELGHGSNVRGIETQAIYDENTQGFILHSPTVTSYKW